MLVLDDYHVIDSKAIHESLTFMLEHRPPQLHLVVLSRVDPPLPMARLRAAGQLAELRADDLRFSVDETAALVRSALQVALPDNSVAALAARTEGWAVGLRLATLSLQGHPDAAGFVQAFSGSHHFVLDYLSEEVLERQPEPIRRFLLETSVLDRLSGELCDAVTGRTDSRTNAGSYRSSEPVRRPPGRCARVVALPPALRRSAARSPSARMAGPRHATPSQRRPLVRTSLAG